MTQKSKCLGVGIIGAGVIFEQHARALSRLGDVARLIAVADVDPYRLRDVTEKHFIPFAYSDYGELIARDDIDIVVVATPPSLHEHQVIEALEAGKNVNCEKPLSTSLAAADRIIAASHQYGHRLSVGHQLRFSQDFQKLDWVCQQGRLGQLRDGLVVRRESFPDSRFSGWWGRWDVAGGGVVITQFIHQLDLLVQLLGPPQSVTAHLETRRAPIESEDTFEAEITFSDDLKVRCEGTIVADGASASQLKVRGDSGAACYPWSLQDCSTEAKLAAELDKRFPPYRKPNTSIPARVGRKILRTLNLGGHTLSKTTAHGEYYKAMIDAIQAGQPMPVTPEDSRTSLDLSMGIYAAGIYGGTVELPLDTSHPLYHGVSADQYESRHTSQSTCRAV